MEGLEELLLIGENISRESADISDSESIWNVQIRTGRSCITLGWTGDLMRLLETMSGSCGTWEKGHLLASVSHVTRLCAEFETRKCGRVHETAKSTIHPPSSFLPIPPLYSSPLPYFLPIMSLMPFEDLLALAEPPVTNEALRVAEKDPAEAKDHIDAMVEPLAVGSSCGDIKSVGSEVLSES